MKRFPAIVSSPSGGGKTSIVEALLKRDKSLSRVITATTRQPRKGEKNGKDYYFWTEDRFKKTARAGKMLEWAKVHANYYGIPKSSFDDIRKAGKDAVLVIDVQGAKTVKKLYKNAVSVFIAPPSLKTLAKRIAKRADGTKDVALRIKTAREEMKRISSYDYVIINDKFDDAVKDLETIIKAERLRTIRRGR
jgi:guanylate kinase